MNKKNSKRFVLDKLEDINFPKNKSRKNVSDKLTEAFALGTVNYRGQKYLGGKTRGPSRFNQKFPELYKAAQDLINLWKPDFQYTTIQVNKNVQLAPHVDKNNVGPSYIIALGDFTGGKLVIEGESFNIKNKWRGFNGTLGHWVEPFKGTRYSLVYFTHTFKPPCPSLRNVEVKPCGLYKNNELLKSYPSKILCVCGSVIQKRSKARHERSKKHRKFLDQNVKENPESE